jgi:hypothetical protein
MPNGLECHWCYYEQNQEVWAIEKKRIRRWDKIVSNETKFRNYIYSGTKNCITDPQLCIFWDILLHFSI